ncbi:MAG TPA: hypothetical protein VF722_06730 [Gemmatimonadaceae bacterium]|jgi:hypothetical protein|nr:hypothetical protein [Terriglobia bacterium]HKS97428.1 hypothetical protein [Terriglobia bacterium]
MAGMVRRTLSGGSIGLLILAVAACKSGEQKAANGDLMLHGTVHMVQSDSGGTCWKFQSTKGNSYELQPAQVPSTLLVDGATAVLEAKPRSGGSFCNVGQIIDVVKADSITAGAAPSTASD